MSIQQVQTQNILDLISKSFLSGGQSPLLDDVFKYMTRFFGSNPTGLPFQVPREMISGTVNARSDPEFINALMATIVTDIDVLYETCLNHVDQTLMLNTVLRNHLERLRIKRALLNSRIDDYLLGIYNSDGYFYSFSDGFSTVTNTDLNYTSAFIDTATGAALIPSVSSLSKLIDRDAVTLRQAAATDATGNVLTITSKSLIKDAFDGLNNTSWLMEVKTNKPGPIVLDVELQLSTQVSDNLITRIDLDPHTVTPIQYGINAIYRTGTNNTTSVTEPFANQVKTSTTRCSFVSDNPKTGLNRLHIQMKKDKHDYTIDDAREQTLVYMFGFKEIVISEQYFDPEAQFVSKPISIPSEISGEAFIDAVSVVVEDNIPSGTSATYYVAADIEDALNIQDFSWVRIDPISDAVSLDTQIVRFNSTSKQIVNVRLDPRGSNDLDMIQLNSTSADLSQRNPTTSYFDEIDVYRICKFSEPAILNTLRMEEGFNTTRIYYTDLRTNSLNFDFWEDILDTPTSYFLTHGEIDSGHGFLYGADIGENGKSIYAETYVYVDEASEVILKECRKLDSNAKTWGVKIFLNGREIASLPVGTNNLTVPWKFQQGKNHVAVMAEIPDYTASSPAPYIGSFSIMADSDLFDYGVVKLDDWIYVDPYKFETNLTSESRAFTIYNNEIVSRKKPTDNFRLIFNTARGVAPSAVRFRADFTRSNSFAHVTPILDFYRIRFSYS